MSPLSVPRVKHQSLPRFAPVLLTALDPVDSQATAKLFNHAGKEATSPGSTCSRAWSKQAAGKQAEMQFANVSELVYRVHPITAQFSNQGYSLSLSIYLSI